MSEKLSFKVFLDRDLYDWLQKEATRRFCPMSAVVRQLILEKMEAEKDKVKHLTLYKPPSKK